MKQHQKNPPCPECRGTNTTTAVVGSTEKTIPYHCKDCWAKFRAKTPASIKKLGRETEAIFKGLF